MPARGAEPDRLRSLSLSLSLSLCHGESVQQWFMSGHVSQQLAQQDLLCNKQGIRQSQRERSSTAKKEGKEEDIAKKKREVVMTGRTAFRAGVAATCF